jgi:RNA polymerase sigma factor (sigma-70 family)
MPGGEAGLFSPYHPHNRRDSRGGDRLSESAAWGRTMSRETLFLQQLPVIERVIGWVCGRQGLRGADAEDFASTVKLRLIENDYEVLAKYQGRSHLKTYLTSVITRCYLDFQDQRFGKWRTSAAAGREGALAVRLERLVYRDGLSFDEACGVLESDPQLGKTRDELHAIFVSLPQRTSRRSKAEQLQPAPTDRADEPLERSARQELADRAFATVRCSLSRQPARDRVLWRLVYQSRLSVADAARALRADQKALYRRLEKILEQLRADLAEQGIGPEQAQELLGSLDWEAALDAGPDDLRIPEECQLRPSKDLDGPTGGKVKK